jgi:triosephosphate isomerase
VSERRPLVAANWKMHLVRGEAVAFARALLASPEGGAEGPAEVAIFPSFPLLPALAEALAGSAVAWGGQDLHPEEKGAHTGDVSAAQLADCGCRWALCGHSERRRDHGESDELVARKATAARRHRLEPLVCIGETLAEREAGRTLAVLERQLRAVLGTAPDPFAIAYEPVWAIGTGKTATPEMAQDAHRFVRQVVGEFLGERAAATRVLYGGSVTPENAADLAAQPDVDGFLVGGASLDAGRFAAIIRCFAR